MSGSEGSRIPLRARGKAGLMVAGLGVLAWFLVATPNAAFADDSEKSKELLTEKETKASQEKANLSDFLLKMNMLEVRPGIVAPEFYLSSLTGETVSLSQYRGKAVLLSFWATW